MHKLAWQNSHSALDHAEFNVNSEILCYCSPNKMASVAPKTTCVSTSRNCFRSLARDCLQLDNFVVSLHEGRGASLCTFRVGVLAGLELPILWRPTFIRTRCSGTIWMDLSSHLPSWYRWAKQVPSDRLCRLLRLSLLERTKQSVSKHSERKLPWMPLASNPDLSEDSQASCCSYPRRRYCDELPEVTAAGL